MFIKIANAGW